MLKGYIADLRAITEEDNRHRMQASKADFKPLTLQIEELMRSLPPALLYRPWSMNDIVPRLRGRYSQRPHAAHVGQALLELGWVRVRNWTASGAGRRYWKYQRH